MDEFKKGDKVKILNGSEATIIDYIAGGGQGDVYRVNYNNKEYALKWYKKNAIKNEKAFYENLENNVLDGKPNDSFLWMQYLTEKKNGSFGYLMDLRPSEYKEFKDFLLVHEKFESLTACVTAALNIVNGFRDLHGQGKSYQDLNDGNFFINPKTGDVLICDNDNVAPYGKNLGIKGKMRYMAPEVVLSKKDPDTNSDRFSLSVILFMLFFLSHPLEGQKTTQYPCLTDKIEKQIYGSDAVFIYDEANASNRPERGIHKNALIFWNIYPEFIKKEFQKAFSKNVMKDPNSRLIENEWKKKLTALRDMIIIHSCGDETFYDYTSNSRLCINCKQNIGKMPVLEVKKHKIVLCPKKKIYLCHTDVDSDDYKIITGEIVQNKNNKSLWGIRNLSGNAWTMLCPDNTKKIVNDNGVALISNNMKINFGNCIGEIKI